MSSSEVRSATAEALCGEWPSAPWSCAGAELQSRLDLSLPFRELGGMQAFMSAKAGL